MGMVRDAFDGENKIPQPPPTNSSVL